MARVCEKLTLLIAKRRGPGGLEGLFAVTSAIFWLIDRDLLRATLKEPRKSRSR